MTRTTRRLRRPIATLGALGLFLAACGDDSDTESSSSTPESVASVTTTRPPSAGGGGAATDEDFLALCPPESAPDSLTIAIWGSHQDAVGEAMEGFTELTGVKINWHIDGTGDRLTKLNAERGNPTLDVAIIPVNEVSTLLENKVIIPADDRVPNSGVLVDAARSVEGGWGTSQIQFGLAYDPAQVPEPPTKWLDLLDPKYEGNVSIGNLPGSGGYAALAMLAHELGGDETDLEPAIEAVAEVKDSFLEFSEQAQPAIQLFESGELWLYSGIAGTMAQYAEDSGKIEVIIPESGGPLGMNVGVIPAGNPDEECAMAMLGWYLGPEVQTAYAETLRYSPVNSAVELPDELKDKVYPQSEDTVVVLDWAAIQARSDEYLDLWMRKIGG